MSIVPVAPITNIPSVPYPFVPPPFTDVAPLTYRDGTTYLEYLKGLNDWIQNTLIPYIDNNLTSLGQNYLDVANNLITTVNDALNSQADTVNIALSTQETNVNNALAAMQTQVDQAVVDVENSAITVQDPVVEGILTNPASQSRVALDGIYESQANLDANTATNVDNLSSATGAAVNTAIINGQGMTYVIPTGSTADQAQTILTNAVSGSEVRFSPGTYETPLNGFTLANDNVTIDSSRATITSANWGTPAFDLINRNSVTLKLGTVQYVGARGSIAGTFRGSANYVGTSAVWANGSGIRVESLHSIDYVCGVFFSSWNGTTLNGQYGSDNYIGDVEVESYNFGVLFTAQNNLIFDNLYAHDDMNDTAGVNPSHAIYGSSVTNFRDSGVTVNYARTLRNLNGHAYQFKYSDRLTINNAVADTCTGILSVIDCHDMQISAMTSTNDSMYGTLGSFSMQSTDLVSQRPVVNNVTIKSVANITARPVLIISQDGVYTNFVVDVNFINTVNPTATPNIDVRGDNNYLNNIKVINRGTATNAISFGGAPISQSAKIGSLNLQNALNCVYLGADVAGIKIYADRNNQSYTGVFVSSPTNVDYSVMSLRMGAISTFGENAILNTLITGSPVHPAANQGVQVKIRPTEDITVTALKWWSVVQNGNYDIAIYDDTSNALLWSKGSGPWPSVGVVNEIIPNVILRGGKRYRVSIAADNNVGSYRGIVAPATQMDVNTDGTFQCTQVAAVFPLPSTLVAGGTSCAGVPLIVLTGSKNS